MDDDSPLVDIFDSCSICDQLTLENSQVSTVSTLNLLLYLNIQIFKKNQNLSSADLRVTEKPEEQITRCKQMASCRVAYKQNIAVDLSGTTCRGRPRTVWNNFVCLKFII